MDEKEVVGADEALKAYRAKIRLRIDTLLPVFAAAAVGDFSSPVRIPEVEDEFTELYAGIEILLEVVRKRIEEEELAKITVEKEKAKDGAILKSIADGMIVTDDRGSILLINKPTEEMFGWKNDEVVGKLVYEIFIAEDEKEQPVLTQITTAIAAGKRFSISGYMMKKDRSLLPVSISAAPVIFGSKVTGAVVLIRDVTKEREIDRAKNEFVALASHQLRTPLSIINWYADGLLTGTVGSTPVDRKKYLDGIYKANRRMIELVDALLNVSRIDLGTVAIKPEPVHFKEICSNILEEFAPQIEQKKLSVTVEYDDALPLINADPKFMRIIFENLISNSVKYTPSGGMVTVRIQKRDEDALISVSDTGYGIPYEQKNRIFTKLFRADNIRAKETDGTGLGLYIVKSVVEQSGGKIWFESEENKGSTFYVSIPLAGMKAREGVRGLT